MPIDEMSAIINKEMETNVYLHRAIAKLQGPEFQAVANGIQAMPEFKDMLENMRSVGLPVDCLMYQLETMLGWESSPCACLASGQMEIIISEEVVC